jgi:hypothetical protein
MPTENSPSRASRGTAWDDPNVLVEEGWTAVAKAWQFVRRHPVPTAGAVAAGVGAYLLLDHFLNDKGRAASRRGSPSAKAARSRPSRSRSSRSRPMPS